MGSFKLLNGICLLQLLLILCNVSGDCSSTMASASHWLTAVEVEGHSDQFDPSWICKIEVC